MQYERKEGLGMRQRSMSSRKGPGMSGEMKCH